MASVKAYFEYRSHLNFPDNQEIKSITQEGLSSMVNICSKMHDYPHKGTYGQHFLMRDVKNAEAMLDKISKDWDVYGVRKFEN